MTRAELEDELSDVVSDLTAHKNTVRDLNTQIDELEAQIKEHKSFADLAVEASKERPTAWWANLDCRTDEEVQRVFRGLIETLKGVK